MAFPTNLDSFTAPAAADYLNSPAHATQHSGVNTAVVALETKMGTGASNASAATADYLLKADGAGASAWSQATEASILLADNTTNDVSVTAHGFVPKAPNLTTQFLRGDASWAIPTNGIKIGTLSRDYAGASGDVAYTGVGFQPTHLLFFASDGVKSGSWGMDNATNHYCILRTEAVTEDTFDGDATYSIKIYKDGSSSQKAIVKTLDADGFTLTWTKTGTPTGTITVFYMAFK